MTDHVVTFTADEIAAAVKSLLKSQKNAARAVESLLVMAVFDSIVNKSPATANALIGSLRTSTKQTGIVAFLEKFGQLYDKGGKGRFVHFALGAQERLVWDADYVAFVKDEAMSWESFKPATEEEAVDVVKMVEAVIAKANKAKAKGRAVIDAELAELLGALVAQYTSRKAISKAMEGAKEGAKEGAEEGATV
jgi:hypothetical protein